MSDIKQDESIGGLIISEEVIASISKNAALDVEGVAGAASQPVTIGSVFHKSDALKFVRVHSSDSEIVIDVYVKLKYGVKIPTVSEVIQRNVKEAVQNMTGRVVTRVNVHIMDIVLPTQAEQK